MTTLGTLRQLQVDATPGPWSAYWHQPEPCVVGLIDYTQIDGYVDPEGREADIAQRNADRAVAAAAPSHLADLITALEREAKVRELHRRIPVYEGCFREDCPDATEDEHLLLDNGGWVHTNELIGHSCSHCYELSDDDWPDYPCPTIRILDGNE